MLFGVAAEDEDADIRRLGADHRQRVDTALSGHRQIHDEHVEFCGAHQFDGFASRTGFAYDPKIDVFRENWRKPERTMAWSSTIPILIICYLVRCPAH